MNSPTISSRPKRTFTSQFKLKAVQDYLRGNKSQAEICRDYAICPTLLNKWKVQFEKNAPLIFEDQNKRSETEKIEKLERIIGKQAIEIDFLKRGLQFFNR